MIHIALNPFIAESVSPLTNAAGEATAAGAWFLVAIGVLAFLAMLTNQILGILLKRKQLTEPPPAPTQLEQPIHVVMAKEFVPRPDFEKAHTEMKNQVTELSTYTHERFHDFANTIATVTEDAHKRGEQLATLKAYSQTQSRTLNAIEVSVGDLRKDMHDRVNAVADRVGELIGEVRHLHKQ